MAINRYSFSYLTCIYRNAPRENQTETMLGSRLANDTFRSMVNSKGLNFVLMPSRLNTLCANLSYSLLLPVRQALMNRIMLHESRTRFRIYGFSFCSVD